jgi:hypothetical protein
MLGLRLPTLVGPGGPPDRGWMADSLRFIVPRAYATLTLGTIQVVTRP